MSITYSTNIYCDAGGCPEWTPAGTGSTPSKRIARLRANPRTANPFTRHVAYLEGVKEPRWDFGVGPGRGKDYCPLHSGKRLA